jgi:5-methyltetrahydrofolate--homocysteine methyltransferase
METLHTLSTALQKGDVPGVTALTREAIAAGTDPQTILDAALIAGMAVVGERFKRHEIFLPHVLLAARAMYAGMDVLKPLLIREGIQTAGRVVIGSVRGDLHDIGKNLVAIMLKGAGFEVIDLGNDVPPERFVETAEKEKADVIGLSALLTTTMPVMQEVVDHASRRGIRGNTRIIVGGAPLTAEYARQIGADAYCFDAMSAVEYVKQCVGRAG